MFYYFRIGGDEFDDEEPLDDIELEQQVINRFLISVVRLFAVALRMFFLWKPKIEIKVLFLCCQEEEDEAESRMEALPSAEKTEGQSVQERMTTPFMTKYERARILGTRALQIA